MWFHVQLLHATRRNNYRHSNMHSMQLLQRVAFKNCTQQLHMKQRHCSECPLLCVCVCKGLVTASCADGKLETEVAFYNFRFVQGVGVALAYASSAAFCVAVRLYIVISLLVLAVVLYVAAEYRLRRDHQHASGHVTVETDTERR